MSELDTWRDALQTAGPLLDRLQELYRRLPETECRCETPGVCCAFIPEMTALEALGWLRLVLDLPAARHLETVRRFVAFYLTNPMRHSGCPLLGEGYCSAYEQRTFACRAYGLWSLKTGRQRTAESREGKRTLLEAWKRYGVELPPERVVGEMDYCDRVRCRSRKPLRDEGLMSVLESVYRLSCRLDGLQQRFETQYHSDFSFLITALALGPKKAVLGKFAVIKELVRSGGEERLEKLLARVKPLTPA